MFADDQERYLLRQLSLNNVVLFLGAGFSVLATNRANRPLPLASELATALWSLLGTDDPPTGEPLGEVFQAIMAKGVPYSEIRNFLEDQLICKTVPDSYDAIVAAYWYRIYTLNIDNLLDVVYRRSNGPNLSILAYPGDDVTERDQGLATIQAVHLNGRLPCSPAQITFSPRQYGQAAARSQPLYQQFVRDYATKPVLFVGTQFQEPLFWEALAARGDRFDGQNRPLSFLVTRSVSSLKRIQLKELNVEPIEMDTADFLAWLRSAAHLLPDRATLISAINPELAALLNGPASGAVHDRDLRRFSESISPVPLQTKEPSSRSLYLLGAAPRWEDLLRDLDAPRSITDDIVTEIDRLASSGHGPQVIAVLGSAGSGKSTILRRAGLRVGREGRRVLLTNSETVPSPQVIKRVLASYSEPIVLLFDNAEIVLPQLPDIITDCIGLEQPVIFVVASRTNDFDRLWRRLGDTVPFYEFPVPNLDRHESEAVIATLERNGLLGTMRGLTSDQRMRLFEEKASRQILVAMREATTSIGFDQIIRDEFECLVPLETKLLYLCVALTTDAGYRLTKDEFVGCAHVSSSEALSLLSRNLRDIVISFGASNNLLLLRHRLIAELVVEQLAPRTLLRDAYIRVLTSISIYSRTSWRDRSSGLVRALLNHRTIYVRFASQIDEARAIYESVQHALGHEPHFWLQFGNLELEGEGGDLAYAENYLRQAEALAPTSGLVRNALGHLLIKKGTYASDLETATEYRQRGSDILREQISSGTGDDVYAVHIFCRQRYAWMRRWLTLDKDRESELRLLIDIITTARKAQPKQRRLIELHEDLKKALLYLTIPTERRPPSPTLSNDES